MTKMCIDKGIPQQTMEATCDCHHNPVQYRLHHHTGRLHSDASRHGRGYFVELGNRGPGSKTDTAKTFTPGAFLQSNTWIPNTGVPCTPD
ncbi:hypothetical protein F3Y22_tig00116970pilonHSYRG00314 [Hibiscus syriacus]|uniref:Uncharacterized protein n=1 Tax=Hibiscus syriacus TaxID=106335 RepID=A0A6A2XR07_HIBSY|nr:hypothetical protein F3Y22_tig00116970pilonHSYRG00314 [Hibiscus syriacus]